MDAGPMGGRFKDQAALVTGGGSGLGEMFCRRLAHEGARVAVLDRDEAAGGRVAEEITASGGVACFIPADVTDAAGMAEAVAAASRRHGPLNVAINSAGIGTPRRLLTEVPLEAWHKVLAVNLTGAFYSMRAEIPAMGPAGGSIVNIASITGVVAHPMSAAYVASKHGLIGLTKSAALEWGPRNIRVNAVAPTFVRTPMTLAIFDEARWAELDAQHALRRCVSMEEVTAVVCFLASQEASSVTGSVYMADAGYTAV